jgi:hypothetical protein
MLYGNSEGGDAVSVRVEGGGGGLAEKEMEREGRVVEGRGPRIRTPTEEGEMGLTSLKSSLSVVDLTCKNNRLMTHDITTTTNPRQKGASPHLKVIPG